MEKKPIFWEKLSMEMRPKVRFWVPAAAMDEEDLREEIRQLYARGFGGVEVVVLEALPPQIATGEDGWGTENWNRMVDVIADETCSLGMSMDLANGPGWPIASPAILDADDPAALYELVWGIMDVEKGAHYCGPLPERRTVRSEGTPKLLHVLAYLEKSESVLAKGSYLDLRPYLQGEILDYTFPEGEGLIWKVFAFYGQPACHKVNAGQTYAVDHLSKSGIRACEDYWNRVFKEHRYASMESFFCDSLEYDVKLDWSRDFPEEFEHRCGYSILPYLPFIGFTNIFPPCDVPGFYLDDKRISDMVNQDYAEVLTQCYCENHLSELERMAGKYGKTVRYQVAYNKPFEEERCGLFVAVPENEALGRAFIDGQKLMAAAAHLGRKERYSFECAAEFGHSYGQDYEDLFWWIKRSLMAGMNAQVLHGASYSGAYYGKYSDEGRIPGTEWPGFEGFGKLVSNYWNRTLSVKDSRGCMDAVTRLNTVFRKQAKVDCAVFRSSYTNDGAGSEHAYYQDGGKLVNRGYSWEMVSDFLLHLPVCTVSNKQLDEVGVGYRCLIIPEQKAVSTSFLKKTAELADAGLPVLWIGKIPVESQFYSDFNDKEKQGEWEKALTKAWNHKEITHVDGIDEVPNVLSRMGIRPRAELDGKKDMMTAVRSDGKNTFYAIYQYNRVEYDPDDPNPEEMAVSALYRKGSTKRSYHRPGEASRSRAMIRLQGKGTVYLCDYWTGNMYPLDFIPDNGDAMFGYVDIQEDELILLCMCDGEMSFSKENGSVIRYGDAVKFETLELHSFEPNTKGEMSFLRSGMEKRMRKIQLDGLLPWKDLAPELVYFSGEGIYRGVIRIDEKMTGSRYILYLGNVSDTFSVKVNDIQAEFPDQVLKRLDITEQLQEGKNKLEVRVTSNLYNRVFQKDMTCWGMPIPYIPRNYGIWEEEGKHVVLIEYPFHL